MDSALLSSDLVDKLIELYNRAPRLPYRIIARKLGIDSSKVVSEVARLQRIGTIPKRTSSDKMVPTVAQSNRRKYILALERRGLSQKEIAAFMKVSPSVVSGVLRGNNHCPNYDHLSYLQELIDLYNQSPRLVYSEIAEKTGLTINRLKHIYKSLRDQGRIKPRCYNGFLDPTQQQLTKYYEIVAMRQANHSWDEIGRKYKQSKFAAREFIVYTAKVRLKNKST